MKKFLFAILLLVSWNCSFAQGGPPPQAFEDCKGKAAGDTVLHSTKEGKVEALCENTPQGLVARPKNKPSQKESQKESPQTKTGSGQRYTIEQAISDKAQLHTIAFDGLAFLTGDFGYDTFLPPGKVSDYFGFQYMRDIDAAEGGHRTSFLTQIASYMLTLITDTQKAELLTLAKAQEAKVRLFAQKRFPLIQAFRQNLSGELPSGTKTLSKSAVVKYSAELYTLDGEIAYERAKVMGAVIKSFSQTQKEQLSKLQFGDSRTWPTVAEPLDKRSMSHEINVLMMTYASEMFSWYAGSTAADTYFCPERHGMYFGGFGMKTAPAMGKKDYSISTSLTGDSGEAFLNTLTVEQKKKIVGLIDLQRNLLNEIVSVRKTLSENLRLFISGASVDKNKILSLSSRYGELDGEMSYYYAVAFAEVGKSLSAEQKSKLQSLRTSNPSDPKGPFIYSSPVSNIQVGSTSFLFQ